jgi:UDP-N-acetylglucosamine 2-epimerase (non-hydrolysing)
MRVMVVIGTRPEIIKMAPVVRAFHNKDIELTIVHTGQHYDFEMSQTFFDSLNLPKPSVNFNVGSGSHIYQISSIITKLEKITDENKPDILLAQGDTNSVLASSLVCIKNSISFGHVEAGIRSFDYTMPEEINRKYAAIAANMNFAPTDNAVFNLLFEGIDFNIIYLTGNTIVDATLQHLKLSKEMTSKDLEMIYDFISGRQFILCTLHRPSNVDNKESLNEILNAFHELCNNGDVIILPIHPRTVQKMKDFQLYSKFKNISNLLLTNPLNYLNFIKIMSECSLILTDSGGVQEEAVTLKKFCVTLRHNTERPETIKIGINILCKTKKENIIKAVRNQLNKSKATLNYLVNPYGDGKAGEKIVDLILDNYEKTKFTPPCLLKKGSLTFKLEKINNKISRMEFEKEYGNIVSLFNSSGDPLLIPEILDKDLTAIVKK